MTLAYAEGWPAIEAIDADVRIEGTRLTIDATRGRVVRRRHRQDARRDRRHDRRSSAAARSTARRPARRRLPALRQRESRRGLARSAGHGGRRGGRATAQLALKIGACRCGEPDGQQGRRRIRVHRRAVAHRRRCRCSRSSTASSRSPSTMSARATSRWKSSADRRSSPSRPVDGQTRGHGQRDVRRSLRCGASTPSRILDRVSGSIDWSMNVDACARARSAGCSRAR